LVEGGDGFADEGGRHGARLYIARG
jgi:hypothetical protein